MPDLKQLRVLRAVSDAGSFSAAADELDYTQPAVSRIVASLERELGAVLVERGVRPVRLTDAGRAVAGHAEEMFERLATAEAEVRAIARVDLGTLSIGTFSSAGATFVVQAICELRRLHPRVEVSIIEGMPSTLIRQLRGGALDLAVVFDFRGAGEDIGDGLELHHLMDDPLDVVLPSDHALARATHLTVADLAQENWLLPAFGPESPSLKLIDRACAAAGFEPRVVFRVNDCQMTQAMVAAGEGISLLPRLMLNPVRADVTVRALTDAVAIRRIAAARLPARYHSPATQRFLTMLRDAAERHARRT